MITGSKIAPNYQELRPMKAETSAAFPVYKDLPDLTKLGLEENRCLMIAEMVDAIQSIG
jgi:hypothetical protein